MSMADVSDGALEEHAARAREATGLIAGGSHLSLEQAVGVMDAVMAGAVSDVQFGAIFTMLHLRGEQLEELVGFARSMRAHVVPVLGAPHDAIDTCGTGGDGADTFNVSTTAAFVATGAGAVVAKHGNRAVSSSCGSADVLEMLGGVLDTGAEAVAARLAHDRFAFMFAPAFHPSMRHAVAPRRALGLRTAFNFLGPITNPAGVARQVVGVSDASAAERIAAVLWELGTEHALVVHGRDGLDEFTITGATIVHEVTPAGIEVYDVTPEELGEERASIDEVRGGSVERNAEILRAVLAGEAGAARGIVVVNAAAALMVAGIATDLANGADLARESIDSGAAAASLDAYVAGSASLVGEEST